MGYFLGIDGGGSKTAVWCADAKGQIVGKGKSGPTNITATDSTVAVANLQSAVAEATRGLVAPEFEALVMGLAGMDTPPEVTQAKALFEPVFQQLHVPQYNLVNDTLIALKSGSDAANALVVIAGTGSNCFGRNANGQEVKASGLDYWLSDEGSGFAIGSAALKAITQASDGRAPATLLTRPLLQHLQVHSVGELKEVVYGPEFSKREMADIARVVVKAAENGDLVAHQIMTTTVFDIQKLLSTVVAKLELSTQAFDCVMVGSINSLPFVRSRISLWFRLHYPQAKLVYPDKPPVFGAIQMAYQTAFLAGMPVGVK